MQAIRHAPRDHNPPPPPGLALPSLAALLSHSSRLSTTSSSTDASTDPGNNNGNSNEKNGKKPKGTPGFSTDTTPLFLRRSKASRATDDVVRRGLDAARLLASIAGSMNSGSGASKTMEALQIVASSAALLLIRCNLELSPRSYSRPAPSSPRPAPLPLVSMQLLEHVHQIVRALINLCGDARGLMAPMVRSIDQFMGCVSLSTTPLILSVCACGTPDASLPSRIPCASRPLPAVLVLPALPSLARPAPSCSACPIASSLPPCLPSPPSFLPPSFLFPTVTLHAPPPPRRLPLPLPLVPSPFPTLRSFPLFCIALSYTEPHRAARGRVGPARAVRGRAAARARCVWGAFSARVLSLDSFYLPCPSADLPYPLPALLCPFCVLSVLPSTLPAFLVSHHSHPSHPEYRASLPPPVRLLLLRDPFLVRPFLPCRRPRGPSHPTPSCRGAHLAVAPSPTRYSTSAGAPLRFSVPLSSPFSAFPLSFHLSPSALPAPPSRPPLFSSLRLSPSPSPPRPPRVRVFPSPLPAVPSAFPLPCSLDAIALPSLHRAASSAFCPLSLPTLSDCLFAFSLSHVFASYRTWGRSLSPPSCPRLVLARLSCYPRPRRLPYLPSLPHSAPRVLLPSVIPPPSAVLPFTFPSHWRAPVRRRPSPFISSLPARARPSNPVASRPIPLPCSLHHLLVTCPYVVPSLRPIPLQPI
ncbi:hypothetical protein FB451DRAFT_1529350 [Mycena latifolia]|nr:hypothetical protein FB451DRAFT_1529350 [Mycena latifolia]